jgi:hypothetical protein
MAGRHRVTLNPFRWPRRVALLVAMCCIFGMALSVALDPAEFKWAQPSAWGEVVVDNGGGKDHPPADLLRPVA